MLVTMMPEQLLIITVMIDLHRKKGLNSLKMLVFRSLSPGQHKLYPTVPKTEAMKKALELSISKALFGGGHGTRTLNLIMMSPEPVEMKGGSAHRKGSSLRAILTISTSLQSVIISVIIIRLQQMF